MDERLYCAVLGCDEQPRPDEQFCETHERELLAEELAMDRFCEELRAFAKRLDTGWPSRRRAGERR